MATVAALSSPAWYRRWMVAVIPRVNPHLAAAM